MGFPGEVRSQERGRERNEKHGKFDLFRFRIRSHGEMGRAKRQDEFRDLVSDLSPFERRRRLFTLLRQKRRRQKLNYLES